MTARFGSQSMVARLKRVVVKRPEDAFRSRQAIEAQWADLDYLRAPDIDRAAADHQNFVSLLREAGAEILYLPVDDRTGLDSLYAHDPVLITERGAVILQTGKPARRGEGLAFADACKKWDIPVAAVLDGAATAEAGDMLWLNRDTLIIGRSFRTNAAGVRAITEVLRAMDVEVHVYDLPCWNGVREVLHLQSFISMLDSNLAVVYRRLLPVAMLELLNRHKIEIVDVAQGEYDSMACNVLAISPRNAVMVAGNPVTKSRLEAAGCRVSEVDGAEICFPGSGGPTCLTRPLLRA
jgi:N-dimethylarginine dimethylaminohydrolase